MLSYTFIISPQVSESGPEGSLFKVMNAIYTLDFKPVECCKFITYNKYSFYE